MEKSVEIPQKVKNRTTIHCVSHGYLHKENEILIQKDIGTLKPTAALFTVAKIQEQPKCPSIGEWLKKMWCVCVCVYIYIHIYMYIYIYIKWNINHKKKEILPFATIWMNQEGIMLSEINQTEKDKFHLYVESKNQMNKHNETETRL